MDENNNKDDRSVVNKIKNETEKEAKKIKKKLTQKIIAWISPVVTLIVICLLAIGVIMAVAYTVINFFRGYNRNKYYNSTRSCIYSFYYG